MIYYLCSTTHNFSVNSHLIQNRLRIDVTPIIPYIGYIHLPARATVTKWFYKFKQT